jgi:hypothetical protein
MSLKLPFPSTNAMISKFVSNFNPNQNQNQIETDWEGLKKGSTIGRQNKTGKGVLKDLDFTRRFRFESKAQTKLIEQIESDSRFLESINVMDYSFLVGIHKCQSDHNHSQSMSKSCQSNVFYKNCFGGLMSIDEFGQPTNEIYFFGIIDTLTSFQLAKKSEHFFKAIVQDSDHKVSSFSFSSFSLL